ncbi:MAG: hypothetical protein L3K07_09365, partial [Thermoplasmata archaeon]|nr:hypothetical protein [Thermoplasmata archaeon]
VALGPSEEGHHDEGAPMSAVPWQIADVVAIVAITAGAGFMIAATIFSFLEWLRWSRGQPVR